MGTGLDEVWRIDPADLSGIELLADSPDLFGVIGGLAAADVDGDGTTDLVFTRSGRLVLQSGGSLYPSWQSQPLGDNVGAGDEGLKLADYDEDGVLEVLIGTPSGLVVYELGGPLALFADAFESGSVTRWSSWVLGG